MRHSEVIWADDFKKNKQTNKKNKTTTNQKVLLLIETVKGWS